MGLFKKVKSVKKQIIGKADIIDTIARAEDLVASPKPTPTRVEIGMILINFGISLLKRIL